MIVLYDTIKAVKQTIRFQPTLTTLDLVSKINRVLGRLEGIQAEKPPVELRRKNLALTVQSTTAIEGNTLSLEETTVLIADAPGVSGTAHRAPDQKLSKEVLEVRNAAYCYQQVREASPFQERSFLVFHAMMMKGLIPEAGEYRKAEVGIKKNGKLVHLAPKAREVPARMRALFAELKGDAATSPLIQSAVCHYQIEYIHPFKDGNGRMGRLWQYLILSKYHPIFESISVEAIIKQYQSKYYLKLRQSDELGDCSTFVDFSLYTILEALLVFEKEAVPQKHTTETRLGEARLHFGSTAFSRKDYMQLFRSLSTATASRDLATGVERGSLKRTGDKALARYLFVSKPSSAGS